jgi:hypothetical protein
VAKNEKGLSRGGVGGQDAELTNKIAPEGSVERKPLPGAKPPAAQRPRNPFMDEESQARRDRELK